MGIVGNLTSDQLEFFNSQGYLVIESFSSTEDVESLRKRMDQLLDGFDCSSSASIFSTKNQDNMDSRSKSLQEIQLT